MSLQSCEDHDCILVYQGRSCPVCTKVTELESEIEELKTKIEDLKYEAKGDDL